MHRRQVIATDISRSLDDPDNRLASLPSVMGVLDTPVTSGCERLTDVRVLNGKRIRTILPAQVPTAQDVFAEVEPEDIPFTSICYGPLKRGKLPYLLGLSIAITSTAFRRLITELPNHVTRFVYGIEGPEIVVRDIEPMDLTGLDEAARGSYAAALSRGIIPLRVPVHSYDVVTCDEPGEMTDYVRLLVNASRCEANRRLVVGGKEYVVNAWHSDRMDFLIQKTSFCITKGERCVGRA